MSLSREKTFARPKKMGKGKHYLGSSLAIEWAQKSFAVEIGLQNVFTHVTSRFQICCNKRKRLHHKKRVHLPQDTNMATVLMFTNISNMADLTSCGLDLRFLFLSFFLASQESLCNLILSNDQELGCLKKPGTILEGFVYLIPKRSVTFRTVEINLSYHQGLN